MLVPLALVHLVAGIENLFADLKFAQAVDVRPLHRFAIDCVVRAAARNGRRRGRHNNDPESFFRSGVCHHEARRTATNNDHVGLNRLGNLILSDRIGRDFERPLLRRSVGSLHEVLDGGSRHSLLFTAAFRRTAHHPDGGCHSAGGQSLFRKFLRLISVISFPLDLNPHAPPSTVAFMKTLKTNRITAHHDAIFQENQIWPFCGDAFLSAEM